MQEMHQLAERAYEARHSEKISQREKASSEDTFNLFQVILSSSLPESEKKPQRMGNEAFEVIGAGFLTTAKTMTVGTFHILSNPGICQRLKQELRGVLLEPHSMVDIKVLEAQPYLVSGMNQDTWYEGADCDARQPSSEKHFEYQLF